MKNKFKPILFVVALFFAFTLISAFSGTGSGTVGDPYQIINCTQVQEMEDNLTASYQVVNNIDCSATSGWNGGLGFNPVGNSTSTFTGNLDGQEYNITNLSINRPTTENIGLIGYAATGSFINNTNMVDVNITGSNQVGGIIGFHADGTIDNSYSTGFVNGSSGIGGLVGYGSGTISNSFFSGNVMGSSYIGGLIGWNFDTVDNSYSKGNVEGTNWVGGLMGRNDAGTINKSYSNSNVIGSGTYAGGLIGHLFGGTLIDSYATGSVNGSSTVGGLLGRNEWGNVDNTYSTGNVTGSSSVGGLAGSSVGTTCDASFWDNQTSGQSISGCGVGQTTLQMKTQSTFDPPWDFITPVWKILYPTSTYPCLAWDSSCSIPPPPSNCSTNTRTILIITLIMLALGIMVIPLVLFLFNKDMFKTQSTKAYLIVFITVIVGIALISAVANLIAEFCG